MRPCLLLGALLIVALASLWAWSEGSRKDPDGKSVILFQPDQEDARYEREGREYDWQPTGP